jgi:hypothetical protein
MADPTPVLPEQTIEPAPYRPLSGLALASFAIAAIYALVVGVFGFLAIVGGFPTFLSPAALAFPVFAVLLAATARWQIRTSEGARSGMSLATWGLRLGLFFGIAHAAIFLGTLLAVWMQAQNALDKEFIAKIQEGSESSVEDAFQFTVPPDQRGSSQEMKARFSTMEGGKKGPLPRFKENAIVRIIQAGGSDLRTESMGIKGLPDFSQDGYGVVLTYRFTNPEGVFDVQFTLRSKDSKESRKRRWQVIWKDADTHIVRQEFTSLGEKMQFWQAAARDFANRWVLLRSQGVVSEAFLATCPPQDRDLRRRQYMAAMIGNSLASIAASLGDAGQAWPLARFATLVDPNLSCELCMPGFHRYSSGECLDASNFEAGKKTREQILKLIQQNFLRPSQLGLRPEPDPGIIQRVEGDSPHLQGRFSMKLGISEPGGPAGPKYAGEADLVVISDRMPESQAGTPQWQLTSIRPLAAASPSSGPEMDPRRLGAPPVPLGPGERGRGGAVRP